MAASTGSSAATASARASSTLIDSEQRSRLIAAKLGALVRDRWTDISPTPSAFPGGAALVDGPRGWVYLDGEARRSLGGPLAWARKAGVTDLHLIVDTDDGGLDAAGVLARRAGELAVPPAVWVAEGREIRPVEPVEPAPLKALPPEAELFRVLFESQGLTAVEEDGVLLGELRGLEVARTVEGDDGEVRLEIGVGRFDREVGAMMHGDLPDAEALTRVVEIVGTYRRPDAPPHPLNQLVPDRWLRATVVADPSLVGAADLTPAASAVRRQNLLERLPATAIGADREGRALVVVCSTGVDLELVPTAADDRRFLAPGARLVLAVPGRDILPVTTALASGLVEPAEVVAVDDWKGPVEGP